MTWKSKTCFLIYSSIERDSIAVPEAPADNPETELPATEKRNRNGTEYDEEGTE